jgi:hypothetical protein
MTGRLVKKIGWTSIVIWLAGCSGSPNKAEVEKRVRTALPAASADWKDIQFDTRADGGVYVILATRTINGKPVEFSCTKGNDTDGAGVAVRDKSGTWLVKFLYDKEKETESQKMNGTDDDIKTYREPAAELAKVVTKSVRG